MHVSSKKMNEYDPNNLKNNEFTNRPIIGQEISFKSSILFE